MSDTCRVILACALLFPAFGDVANAQPPGWIADSRTGCQAWNDDPNSDDSISWSGPCVNGYAHGKGTLQWFSGGKNYETDDGEFRNGRMNGFGTVAFPNGMRFEGEFRDGKPDGKGTLRSGRGELFSGTWSKGCFDDNGRRAYFVATPKDCGFSRW